MIGISKSLIQSILLLFWLVALTVPSIVTFIDSESKVIVTNLTEEEHHEYPQGKKSSESEKLLFNQFISFLQISKQQSQKIADFYILGVSTHTQKILLPPPKKVV
jgi:hypothetical protein